MFNGIEAKMGLALFVSEEGLFIENEGCFRTDIFSEKCFPDYEFTEQGLRISRIGTQDIFGILLEEEVLLNKAS